MADMISSGFVGKAIDLAVDEIIRHIQIALRCREELRSLDALVNRIMPFSLAIRQYGMALKSGRQISHPHNSQLPVPAVVNDWLNRLNEYLETGRDLVEQCTIPTYDMIARYQLSKRIGRVIVDIEGHLKHNAMIAILNQFGQLERLKSIKEGQTRIEEGIKGIAATIEDRVAAVASSSSSLAASVATTSSSNPPQTLSSFQKPRYIAGPDDLFGQLQNLLIDVKESSPSRIGVVGMGGVGKTLLLRRLEEYGRGVRDKFGETLVLWLTISQNPSIPTLKEELEKQLSGENWRETRYVLFLDDVWECSGDRWLEELRVPETNGSKIIVSTRENRVLLKLGVKRENTFRMKGLDEDDSWRLFCSHAFPYNDSIAPVGLEEEEIAKKVCRECDGLPLAIKVIGAAMAGTLEQSEWELALHRLRSSGKIDAGTQEQLHDRLKLSYEALGAYDLLHQDEGRSLRLCFIYLGAFKEDHEILVEALIKLWMGEGLLGTRNEDDYDPLAIGRMHVNLLLDRCLIEASRKDYHTGQVISVSVHDVLHDLARQIAGSEENCFFRAGEDLRVFPAGAPAIINSTRISLMDNHLSSIPKTFRGTAVRALLLSGNANLNPARMIESLTSVRVLDLSRCVYLRSLPESLGCMKRLIYLNLSRTDIQRVPASITRLKRLQLLDLSSCYRLRALPAGLDKLTSLWYLNASFCRNLRSVPSRLSMLTSLWHLNLNLNMLSMLGESKNLWIEREESAWMVTRSEEERQASGLKNALHSLTLLKHLEFSYGGETITEGTLGSMLHMRTLLMDLRHAKALPDDMSSMSQLRSLKLNCSSLVKIPPWVCDFLHLDFLHLICCRNLEELPALQKLRRLRWLSVDECDKLKVLPGEFGKKGEFRALESFRLSGIRGLEELPALEEGAMPSLKKLELMRCFNLKELPVGVSRLTSLREIRLLGRPMVEEKMKEGGEQWEMIRSLQKDNHLQLTIL